MIFVASADMSALASELAAYDPCSAVGRTAALLTVPSLQANAVRLEILVHLAVAHCTGRKRPRTRDIERWINDDLRQLGLSALEDPAEDVFISNVQTPEGNRRVFEGLWESNDYYIQAAIDTLLSPGTPQECRDLLSPVFALLRLSDCVGERLRLGRWNVESSPPAGHVKLGRSLRLAEHLKAITFTTTDLAALGTDRELLSPFILRPDEKALLSQGLPEDSPLERHPLLQFGDALILSLPSAVSPAARRFVLTELRRLGFLAAFGRALAINQGRQIADLALFELKNEAASIQPPPFDGERVSLHSWLLHYDKNKYIHVVLLHDQLELLDDRGFSEPLVYTDSQRASLDRYLHRVA